MDPHNDFDKHDRAPYQAKPDSSSPPPAPSPRAEGSADELIEAVGIYMVKCCLPSRFEHLRNQIAEVLKPGYSGRNFMAPPAGTEPADDEPACTSCDDTGIKTWNEAYCDCSRGAAAKASEAAGPEPAGEGAAPPDPTCSKHGDPLVCLACEAEEDMRPEWQTPHRVTPPRLRGEPARTNHRCSGCGHCWNGGPAGPGEWTGAELCGDCWRKVQPVLHGEGAAPCAVCRGQGVLHDGNCPYCEGEGAAQEPPPQSYPADAHPPKDTPVKMAKRVAFDDPTQTNLDTLINVAYVAALEEAAEDLWQSGPAQAVGRWLKARASKRKAQEPPPAQEREP